MLNLIIKALLQYKPYGTKLTVDFKNVNKPMIIGKNPCKKMKIIVDKVVTVVIELKKRGMG